jgi:KAP family P-loop domain
MISTSNWWCRLPNDLGFSVAADSAEDLARATRQVVNLASQSRILATSGPWYRSPLAYAIYAALIVGSLGLLIGETVHATHEWLGTAITAIAQLAAVGSALAGWFIRQGTLARTLIAPAESLQRRLDERFAEQQARNDREIAALEQQADAAKMELTIAMRQRTAADVRLANAEKEQAELTGEHLLQRYLTERAASGDYERYMGVVALAHRDLRDLEEYLRASIDENDNAAEKQAGQLDRIVLYIDDLDRCDPDVVADVLDAIHLLLALPLFVVIVGVDPRWLRQSLHKRHPVLLGSAPSDVTWTSAADYLEKIFQLTYSLPRMNANGCANLLTAAAREAQEVSVSKDQRLGAAYLDGGPEKGIGDYEENSGQSSQALGEDLAEALSLHEKDIEALRDVAPLVSISPRRAKRFLNTYLVVRARALGDPALREYFNYGKDVSGPPLDNTLLALLALLLGLPKTMEMSIHDEHSSDSSQSCTLGAWLTETTPATPEEKARLQEFFSLESPIETLPIGAIMQWLPLVYPYLPIGFEGIYH